MVEPSCHSSLSLSKEQLQTDADPLRVEVILLFPTCDTMLTFFLFYFPGMCDEMGYTVLSADMRRQYVETQKEHHM